METIKFKTNIKCSGCIATVAPFLNETAGENGWKVDLQNPDRILTVEKENVSTAEIKNAIEKAGYKAEQLS